MQAVERDVSLDLGDIQGTLLRHRPDKFHGVYLLYRVDDVAAAKASLNRVLPYVTSAADWESPRPFALNLVFTWQGFRAFGLSESELESFPDEFRAGMAARKEILGDSGASDPSAWVAPLGSGDVHIGVIVSSNTEEALRAPLALAQGLEGVTCIYRIDVGVPPTGREHFGYRDGIGGPLIIGSGETGRPGQDAIMPGEFILGYPDESGSTPPLPRPEILTRNGTFLAFRQLHCDVAAFRRFLRANARSKDDEELIAAKMVGRWRSGAPLMLAPEKDDPQLAVDPTRNNDFRYFEADPKGLICPLGSHI
ncbi:MAG: peroxidase, partial [Chloroflexi bacterium]|nr:peroxidase [Chloroflexota bacterium]